MNPGPNDHFNPQSKAFMALLPTQEELEAWTPERVREINASNMETGYVPGPNVSIEKVEIKDHTDSHNIPVSVYRPKDTPKEESLPALVYMHGGGFICPPQGAHPHLASKIAEDAKCAVFFVHYSLSPEVKLPVPLEEVYSVVACITDPETAKVFNVDPTRVAIGGDSSGGGGAAGVALMAKKRAQLKNSLKFQILYYPLLDNDYNTETYLELKQTLYPRFDIVCDHLLDSYVSKSDRDNIFYFPFKATYEDLQGLPPTFLMSCEGDNVRYEDEEYGRRLARAGVPVSFIRVHGILHGFMSFPKLQSEQTFNVIDMTTGALRRAFSTK